MFDDLIRNLTGTIVKPKYTLSLYDYGLWGVDYDNKHFWGQWYDKQKAEIWCEYFNSGGTIPTKSEIIYFKKHGEWPVEGVLEEQGDTNEQNDIIK